jgi:acetyl esterase/lipase
VAARNGRFTLAGGIGFVISTCWLAAVQRGAPADKPPAAEILTIHRDLRYRAGPSKQWRLDLAMKTEPAGRPRPGIVVIHGGGWLEGDKSSFTSRKDGVPGNIEDFAALGFVAVTVNYRLSGEAPFPAALEDCQCAVRWLRAHAQEYHLDPAHIGAFGNSAGGHLALLLGMAGKEAALAADAPYPRESSQVQAVVSDSGPVDLAYQYRHDRLRRAVGQFLDGPPEGERAAVYHEASPVHRITAGTPPLLLIYGGSDEQVPVQTADAFVAALGRAGLEDVSYYRLAYVGNCPYSLVRVPGLRAVVNDFFLRTLMHPGTARQVKRRAGTR